MTGSPLIRIRGLSKSYGGVHALRDVTLDIAAGVVNSLANDQSWATPTGFANTIPSTTNILLRGGSWEVRTMGDSTANFQLIKLGNNIVQQGGPPMTFEKQAIALIAYLQRIGTDLYRTETPPAGTETPSAESEVPAVAVSLQGEQK